MLFVPFYRLNEVFFNTFSHLSLILLEDVSINVRSYSRITMSKVLGNSLDVKSVVNHETGVAVTKCMNAECWQVVIDKDFLQLLVGKAPTVVSDYLIANIRENHINKNVFYSFSKNKEEDKRRVYGKQFLCNAGFYIGLNAEEMEAVLRNEGYTIQCSSRPDDRILFDCFYYSFSRNYASALLKKEGYDGLEIGK